MPDGDNIVIVAAAYNSDWRHYQRRTQRQIPLVILEPRT